MAALAFALQHAAEHVGANLGVRLVLCLTVLLIAWPLALRQLTADLRAVWSTFKGRPVLPALES